jgi:predicted acylesterase/phospholipase RssA
MTYFTSIGRNKPRDCWREGAATQLGSGLSVVATLARLAVVSVLASLTACGTLPRNAVPPDLMATAVIPHMPHVRAPAGRLDPAMERDLEQSFEQESPEDFPRAADGLVHYPHLALSGGGSNGAFGAGFLNGWTSTGKRPTFKIVTGVSTGALMAPFAFLGPAYDGALRWFYTKTRSRDIFVLPSLVRQLLVGESLANTEPLAALIAQYVDAAFIRQIADAHNRGLRLYIGTTDLDSQNFVVWNMGLIATSGRPEAVDLFRKVMLASASIPIAFPPVFFEVEAGGQRYDEMHVDGGVGARMFMHGSLFSPSAIRERAGRGDGREDIFVIHNGRLAAVPMATPRSLRGIALRTLESTGKSASFGDLWRMYAFANREQAGFHWITITTNVDLVAEEVFDPRQMKALYDVGYETARAGPVWSTRPPRGLQWEATP